VSVYYGEHNYGIPHLSVLIGLPLQNISNKYRNVSFTYSSPSDILFWKIRADEYETKCDVAVRNHASVSGDYIS
jgi:hypothetical protein